jgi:glycosidase
VTALWLSPVTASPPGDYGYAVTDYFRLRGNYGSEADFRKLIAAAHARGLRVILDFVPNHLSDQHAYFIDAESRKRASPYFDFFARTHTGDATHYFDWKHLKNLNYDHPEVQRLIIEAFLYWVREFDVDGFRVDVAWGPRERAPDFWPRWRRELKRVKPDLLLLAEASARDPYYLRDGFDVAYDWTEKLGEWAWHEAFENDAHTAQRLRAAIARSLARSGPAAPIFRFLNNNDTGARFITRHGLARTRVAAAVLLTMPGVPGLFTGDEVGAAFEPYRAARPIVWDDSHPLRTWYARLAELRRTHPALRSGELRLLEIEHADQVLGYQRWNREPEQTVLVLLNFGSDPTTVSLPGEALRSITQRSRLVDLVTDEEITAAGAGIPLAGYGVRILEVRR